MNWQVSVNLSNSVQIVIHGRETRISTRSEKQPFKPITGLRHHTLYPNSHGFEWTRPAWLVRQQD